MFARGKINNYRFVSFEIWFVCLFFFHWEHTHHVSVERHCYSVFLIEKDVEDFLKLGQK